MKAIAQFDTEGNLKAILTSSPPENGGLVLISSDLTAELDPRHLAEVSTPEKLAEVAQTHKVKFGLERATLVRKS